MRGFLLKVHLYLGLVSALVLIVLGFTGAVIAFEHDIEHWAHPSRWYVADSVRIKPMEEHRLIADVERQAAPALVTTIRFAKQSGIAQVFDLTDGSSANVDPGTGAILYRGDGSSALGDAMGALHQIHLRLVPYPRNWPALSRWGKAIVSYTGLALCVLAPTGIILWWRGKRWKVRASRPWFRFAYELHQVIGIYAAAFLFLAAFTGILIGFDWGEQSIFALTNSERPTRTPPPKVTPHAPADIRVTADQAIAIAVNAMPAGAAPAIVRLPVQPTAPYFVELRVPDDRSPAAPGSVAIDPVSGAVLSVHNVVGESRGYRMIRLNRAIHTGDFLWTPTHILMSLSSLMLAIMALTGLVIWWKKQAVKA